MDSKRKDLMEILIKNQQRKIPIKTKFVKSKIKKILQHLELQDFAIGIWFTTNKTIKKYNNKYRKKNKATDILSFPYHPDLKPEETIKIDHSEDKNLGDIIISVERVKKDASELNQNFDKYLLKILVHGIAHLLGYDHITDKQFEKMQQFEAKLLSIINKPCKAFPRIVIN